jgi:hypothetical protein
MNLRMSSSRDALHECDSIQGAALRSCRTVQVETLGTGE